MATAESHPSAHRNVRESQLTEEMSMGIYDDYRNPLTSGKLGQDPSNEDTTRTLDTGDTAHIDLAQNLDINDVLDISDDNDDSDGQDQEIDLLLTVTSPAQFSKSPTLNSQIATTGGEKSDNQQAIYPYHKISPPSLDNVLKSQQGGRIMALGDLFDQTQGASSPLPCDLRSDPISDRPSPIFNGLAAHETPRHAPTSPLPVQRYNSPSLPSPLANDVSPILYKRPEPTTIVAEPRSTYESVQASQERRQGGRISSEVQSGIDLSSEDELNWQGSLLRRARLKRKRSSREVEEMRRMERVTAPIPSNRGSKMIRQPLDTTLVRSTSPQGYTSGDIGQGSTSDKAGLELMSSDSASRPAKSVEVPRSTARVRKGAVLPETDKNPSRIPLSPSYISHMVVGGSHDSSKSAQSQTMIIADSQPNRDLPSAKNTHEDQKVLRHTGVISLVSSDNSLSFSRNLPEVDQIFDSTGDRDERPAVEADRMKMQLDRSKAYGEAPNDEALTIGDMQQTISKATSETSLSPRSMSPSERPLARTLYSPRPPELLAGDDHAASSFDENSSTIVESEVKFKDSRNGTGKLKNFTGTSMQFRQEEIDSVMASNEAPASSAQANSSTYLDNRANLISAVNGERELQAPHRVLARFKGVQKTAFYSGSCLGKARERDSAYTIRFDDGNVYDVELNQLRRLEFLKGDLVKVNREGIRKNQYVVRGFEKIHAISNASNEINASHTDIFGHVSLILIEKTRSSSGTSKGQGTTLHSVPIADIYITSNMWVNFADRKYKPDQQTLHTPLSSTFKSSSPPSHSRRIASVFRMLKEPSTTTDFVGPQRFGIFDNMAFAISVSNEDDKAIYSKTIRHHGGFLLENGFQELFDLSADKGSLTVTPRYRHLEFVALLTNEHSRRTKYVEALALDIPCLAVRWLKDCSSNKLIVPWKHYLLPAGYSSLIETVQSRIFCTEPVCAAQNINLQSTFAGRPRMMKDRRVLMITTSANDQEKCKTFRFIFYALGVQNVETVYSTDVSKGASINAEGVCNWDYVYLDEKANSNKKVLGSLRKATEEASKHSHTFKVVDNDSVIQMLVSGQSIDGDDIT